MDMRTNLGGNRKSFGVMRAALCVSLAASALLGGCAPLVIGSAVTAGVVAVDRRTSGAHLEDQAIEFKAAAAFRENLADGYHINANSYNRQVLLTGEVATAQEKAKAEQLVRLLPNVRNVFNELAVGPRSSMTQRSNDTLITGRVRSRVVGTDHLPSNSMKITTERSVVYLQGLATPREAELATEVARTTTGVEKVVRLFEHISEAELKESQADRQARQPADAPLYSEGNDGGGNQGGGAR